MMFRKEHERVPRLGVDAPIDWDKEWENADLPEGERDQWRTLMVRRGTQCPEEAVKLSTHGWTPQDVDQARSNWRSLLNFRHKGGVPADAAGEERQLASYAVLANDVAKYYEGRMQFALGERDQMIFELTRRMPKERRWTQETVGKLLGLTKQRVQAIVKGRGRVALPVK